MKFINIFSIFLFIFLNFVGYAHGNEYILIGKNQTDKSGRPAFILEMSENNLENTIRIGENGEVFVKVDTIFAIPKEALTHSTQDFLSFEILNTLIDTSGALVFDSYTKQCPGDLIPCINDYCRRCISPLTSKCPTCKYIQY